jgi:cell wall-associated NlpC family hydrolase
MRHSSIVRPALPTVSRLALVATTVAGLVAFAPAGAEAKAAHHDGRHEAHHTTHHPAEHHAHHHGKHEARHHAQRSRHHHAPEKGHHAHHAHHAAHHHAHHSSKPTSSDRVMAALDIAIHHEGAPYVYGAAGPNAFDCSGLTSFAYHQAGFPGVPRTSAAQAGFVHRISRDAMRPGDFVFFYDGGGVYHVGLYDGMSGGRRYIVHAPYPGARVRREAIWTDSWFAGSMR